MPVFHPNGIKTQRLDWVDVVRGLGMVLMFYGHFLQQGVNPHNPSAVVQFRFIYSFHMPLFFVMSGFFFRAPDNGWMRMRELVLRRLIPVMFFGLLLFPFWLRGQLEFHTGFWRALASLAGDYAIGRPDLDWVTWFLVCLFVSECLALPLLGLIRHPLARMLMAFVCLWGGLLFCEHSIDATEGALYWIGRTWFFSEAVVALGFYILGQVLFPYLCQMSHQRILAALVFAVLLAVVIWTFRYNHPDTVAVMMAAREHGTKLDFLITALAGSLAMFALGILINHNRLLQMIGRNTLPLLGLNGLFFHYVDPKLLHVLTPANSEWWVALDALLVTALSLLVCAPIVYLLNRYLPQLIGKANVRGPILPAFLQRPSARSQVEGLH